MYMGRLQLIDTKRLDFSIHEEWSQLWGGHNWYYITPIRLDWDITPTATWLMTCTVLGLGFTLQYYFKRDDNEPS